MLMIIGVVLMGIGGVQALGAIIQYSSMSSFERYLAGDQMPAGLVIGIPILLAGFALTIYGKRQKERKDSEIAAKTIRGEMNKTCPSCGLNLAPNTVECPQCHTKIGE